MVRRPSTESPSGPSQSQNPVNGRQNGTYNGRGQVKSEKGLEEEEGDSEGEESEVDRTQVARGLLDDDGEEEEEEEGEEEEGQSPHNSKRARLENGIAEDEEVRVKDEKPRRTGMLPRHADGYVPGSIVRVKLHQFLTYDDVEFRPGPHLNMVLGPNGTGKSSIACALCLGLNFPPNVLGRSNHLKAFVKQGYKDGYIEIELKGREEGRNIVIRRLLTDKMERQQQFLLNGKQVNAKVVTEEVESLGIQVNNLCTFLPQDKVAEFARMTPQELLVATEKAAGNENLLDWHTELIETGKTFKKLSSELATEQEELDTLVRRNANLEREVNAYKQRREIERRVELLEIALPVKEYYDAKLLYDEVKAERNSLHAKKQMLDEQNKPMQEFKQQLSHRIEEEEALRGEKKKHVRNAVTGVGTILNKDKDLQSQGEKIADELANLRTQEKARQAQIAKIRNEIHSIEDELAHPPELEDTNTIEADRKTNRNEIQANEAQQFELREQIQPYVEESARQDVIINREKQALQHLDSVSHRKLENLERWDRNCAEAVKWLRQNQHRFKMEVIEPAVLSVEVKDSRYASIIEAGFNATQLKTFVFQCKEDYKLFNDLVCDSGQALGRPVKVGSWQRNLSPDDINPPPLTHEELRELGFDGYGIDLINFPPGMIGFLQDQPNLHRYAVALRENAVDIGRAADLISRPIGNKGGSGSFATGSVLSVVQRSRYGQHKAQNMTRDIQQAKSFRNAPVDQDRKHEIERRIAQAESLKEESEMNIGILSTKIKEAEQAKSDLERRKAQIEERKRAVNDALKRIHADRLKLSRKQEQLETLQNAPSVDDQREQLRQRGFEIAKRRARAVEHLQDAINRVIEMHREATVHGLRALQAVANKRAVEKHMAAHDTEYTATEQAFEAACARYREAKEDATQKLRRSKKAFESLDDEMRQTYIEEQQKLEKRTSDDIHEEIAGHKARLQLLLVTNSGVIEQYEKRQREIERLRSKVGNQEAQKAKTERKIQRTKDKWLPALQELVANIGEKFSLAFERVDCAGEIRISEHADDYSAWAIDILVKFRDTEQLQLLTGQRQSGGERALTTIMYLMSLTELARAPFSLVDEINQGMDARYERAVHNALVEVTCTAESGQYFLITPKLLTDLAYHERMKVLCVANGEWLPEEGDLGPSTQAGTQRQGRPSFGGATQGNGAGAQVGGSLMGMLKMYVDRCGRAS